MSPYSDSDEIKVTKHVARFILTLIGLLAGAGLYCESRAADGDATPQDRPGELFTDEERSFWAFQPIGRPPPPEVKGIDRVQSPVDRFILAGLEAQGLSPATHADKRTLIRRATFDLIGLPPTPAEVAAFLADESSEAFTRVVDRLLSSPSYGERWARHWLDVARYADSNGLDENLAYANAYRYRDYVVAAFNRDQPFDQFVHEQLAGDLLPGTGDIAELMDRTTATGFLSLGGKMLAEDDPVKMQMDIVDEQVDTIGRAFLGLTVGCARCHDHKFDPLPQADYYALAGIFKSTKTMENFSVVARWQERALAAPQIVAHRDARRQQIAEKKAEAARIAESENKQLQLASRKHVGAYLIAAYRPQKIDELLKQAQLLGGQPQTADLPGVILIEAENFVRGNVLKDRDNYGKDIGVLVNRGEQPNFTEYEIEVEAAGVYQCELRYAAAAARPTRLLINGREVKADAAGRVTGTWFPDSQTWFIEGLYPLAAGRNVVRLENAQVFPHIDKLLFAPFRDADGKSPALPELAATADDRYELIPEIVREWVAYLERTRPNQESLFAQWNAAARRGKPGPGDSGENDNQKLEAVDEKQTKVAAAVREFLWADPKPESLEQLAARYQQLFDSIEAGGERSKSPESGDTQLQDEVRAAIRSVLDEKAGPFAVPKSAEEHYPAPIVAQLKLQRAEIKGLEDSLPVLPETMAVSDGKPENLRVHLRGNHLTLGDEVPRRFPQILAGQQQTPIDEQQSGRLQFARWLTAAENPLTSRVIVNRVWLWHFGEGLVRSPDNFGRLGERPTHPQLLDFLAGELIRSGWSLKTLHRLIMLSSTYQMSTSGNPQAAAVDPENRLWSRANRRRLEAEAIRDSILAVAGTLDSTMGGSLLPTENRKYVTSTANVNPVVYDSARRSIYLPVVRSALYEVLQAFDFADPSTLNGRRDSTTVAPQALFMMNSGFVLSQTKILASKLLSDDRLDDAGRVSRLYDLALSRLATGHEIIRNLSFVSRYAQAAVDKQNPPDESRLRAWQALCRTILASNEFVFVE
ncbi:MAG: DUF1553 domain-containing protein [Planctomycetaceae bacterium]|nr:DUF1553 domain-containing protein [Planctomycetaceae bacterium]